jgi:hypothetical protein
MVHGVGEWDDAGHMVRRQLGMSLKAGGPSSRREWVG